MTSTAGALFAVVACPGCKAPWAVELRNATSTCPRCRSTVELAARKPLWEGDDARDAQAAAAQARQGDRTVSVLLQPQPRHDSPVDAAAAKGRTIINKSARAEEVARWLERLSGPMPHRQLADALVRSGIYLERAEAEITRMLAMDFLMEPKSRTYRLVA